MIVRGSIMELFIEVVPAEGVMHARVKYLSDEVLTNHFYLNRDAEISYFSCDGQETPHESSNEEHPMFGAYMAQKVLVPSFRDCLELAYSLRLSGETGCCPYVRERITPEFTFIRWETFCYPMFFGDWDSYRNTAFTVCNIQLTVPKEYDVVASKKERDTAIGDSKKVVTYSHQDKGSNVFDCSIASYKKVKFSFGSVCFLSDLGAEKMQMVNDTMLKAISYMNEHFGVRNIKPSLVFASIPDGYGSFVCPHNNVVFVEESTFSRAENLRAIVHEYIHLGWNPKVAASVQRARFFDEALTSYFEVRVMAALFGGESFSAESKAEHAIDAIRRGEYKLVPIAEYGLHGYGGLSYTIGALCLHELRLLLGEPVFDNVTKAFLEKYKDVPVDFDLFCREYVDLSGKDNRRKLSRFFDDWIYTCSGISEYINAE